jgi:hypothetical protein
VLRCAFATAFISVSLECPQVLKERGVDDPIVLDTAPTPVAAM